MKVCLCGINGKMGKRIIIHLEEFTNYSIVGIDQNNVSEKYAVYQDFNVCFNNEEIDVVIDFSHYSFAKEVIEEALSRGIKVISGTTGFSKKEVANLAKIAKKNKASFIWSPNFAGGAIILYNEIKRLKKAFKCVDLIESHYKTKLDRPSGTAKQIADLLKIPYEDVQVLRINNPHAIHEVILQNDMERFTISYEVLSYEAFIFGFFKRLDRLLEEKIIIKYGFDSR